MLNLKSSTPNCMLYGELGVTPISLQINSRVLLYWSKLLNCQHDYPCKINVILYKMLYTLCQNDNVSFPWHKYVQNSLDDLGMSNLWHNQVVDSVPMFKRYVQTRIKDQYIQCWNSIVDSSSKCINYRIFKHNFELEKYFNLLPSHLSNILCKFRCCNHKMPIETGRYYGVDRDRRYCQLCNIFLIGDEFHYLFTCSYFRIDRRKYIDRYFYENPNTYKFSQLMNSECKRTLLKLSLFCKIVLQSLK